MSEIVFPSTKAGNEVDRAVTAALSTIPGQITQIDTRVTALEEDVDDLSGLPAQVTQIGSKIGDLTELETTDKTDLVSAINGLMSDFKTLFYAMGNYAFPSGKPTFSWEGDTTITNNLTNVASSNYKSKINSGESYTTTLSGTGLYAIDDSSVIVTMGNTDITSTAYNASTHTISIANVTGNITITASGVTYIASGLAFQLDGLEQGGTDGVWTDLAGGVVWTPYGATKSPDGWYFDGSSYMLPDSMDTYDPANSTVEVCIDSEVSQATYFLFVDASASTVFCYVYSYSNYSSYVTKGLSTTGYGAFGIQPVSSDWGYGKRIVSYNGSPGNTANAGYLNGVGYKAGSLSYSASQNAVIGKRIGSTPTSDEFPFTGKIHSIRIYNRRLTSEEMLHNQVIDNIRFNMGLTIG